MLHPPPPGPEPGPESEHRPLWHVSPFVVQSRQERPAVPHAVSLSVVTQVPPLQQPDAHVARLQPPPPPLVPLEPPLLLPLEPLLLPLEPPLLLLPPPDLHIPAEQTCPFVVQFWQATPPIPHWASVADEMQEGPRQHPLHTPQPPVGVPESWSDPLPLAPPPLPLLPLVLPLPLLPKPPPFPLELPPELPLPPLVLLPPVELPLLPVLPGESLPEASPLEVPESDPIS